MVAGYDGAEPLSGRLPFFALLGLFGAACAAALALVGALVSRRPREPREGGPSRA